jgi:opacity protein-like surface antigen
MKNGTKPSMTAKCTGISCGLLAVAALAPAARADLTATNSAVIPAPSQKWQKPAWLTDLSLAAREGYDNNVLLVSGLGLPQQYSWITTVSPRLGFDFAPLWTSQHVLKTFTFLYAPDFNIYHNAPDETYEAQRFVDSVRATAGPVSLSLDNAFLDNMGSRNAPIYAESQTGNTDDRFRNFFAQMVPRERRDQYQDRGTFALQYNWNQFFIRPDAALIYYNLHTIFHNTTAAPYIGYQNWPDRYDANGGADVGYRVTPNFAVLLGYRYGHQYQEQFPTDITTDRHYASNDYQRALLGLEGNPWSWLNVKISAGPDFRHYNTMAAVNGLNPIFPYAEASVTALITANQTLTFYTKEWQWVASTGLVPYYDSMYTLNYHWNANRHWAFDLGGKVLQANFDTGNDNAGSAPSLRNDIQYTVAFGVTYNFTANLNANLAYNYDIGRNLKPLAPALEPDYRSFDHQLVSLGVQYKF